MSDQMPLSRRMDAGEQRMLPALTVGPYVLLGLLVIFTVIEKHSDGNSLLIDLGLCALAAVWILWMFTLHPAWRVRPRMMAVFFTVMVVITAILVIRDPWFGFLTPAGYFYAFGVLRWPGRLAGVAAVAVVAGTAQASSVNKATLLGVTIYLAVVTVNVLPMCGLTWIDYQSNRQKDQREQALDDVSEANRRLEATLAENAGLHEQLLAQAREAGVLDERQRMAREIHDTLAQGLTGIVTQLQAAEQASDDPAEWRRHFETATRLARESLSEARRSVDALRPEPLETGPAACRAGRRRRPLVGAARDHGPGDDDRHRAADAGRSGARAATHGAGRAGKRGPARAGEQRLGDTVLHGAGGRPGRARRRQRLRTGPGRRVRPGRDAAASRRTIRNAAGRIGTGSWHGDLGLCPGRGRTAGA